MIKLASLLVLLPFFVACAGQTNGGGSAAAKYRVDVGPFFARASGDVALQNVSGNLALGQNQNDLDDNLGVGDTEAAPYLRFQWDRDRHRIRLHGFGVDTESSGTLTGAFGDIAAGTQVTTSLELFSAAGNWAYQILRGERYRVAIGAQVGYYELDVAARSSNGREEVSTDVVVPMPFLEVEGLFDEFTIGANAAGMTADLGDASGIYLDFEGYARWQASKTFDFFAGYRYVVIDAYGRASTRDFDADLELQGFFFGAGVTF